MLSPHILVIGSESATLHAVNAVLANNFSRLAEAATEAEGLARVQSEPAPDLVLLEVSSGNGRALHTLQQLRSLRPGLAIVVLSALGNNRRVVDAIRLGAQDYLNMPLQESELQEVLVRYVRPQNGVGMTNTETAVEELSNGEFFLAASSAMRKVRVQAEHLANSDVPVLILGESGTGKKATARLIHKLSPDSQRQFLRVNCAALPGELLESELFGYERVTSAGAMRTKQGKFELCDNGTILLDEVAEMSANLQAKLLHVFQDKKRSPGDRRTEVPRRPLRQAKRLHDYAAATPGTAGRNSPTASAFHGSDRGPVLSPTAPVLASSDRGVFALLVAGQLERTGQLCEPLPGHGRRGDGNSRTSSQREGTGDSR